MTDFVNEYELLAAEIAKSLREAATALGDRIDGFKALTPFYLQKMKGKKNDDPDDDLPNFDNFTANIHATETTNGTDEPGVRDRRRNGN